MQASRAEVFSAIDGERAYQDEGRGNAKRHEGSPVMNPGECILCLEHLVVEARNAWYKPDGGKACLPHIRKLAAVAVQCMENYGAPEREGFTLAQRSDLRGTTYEAPAAAVDGVSRPLSLDDLDKQPL